MLLTKQQKYLLAVLEKLGCAEQRQLAALLQKAFAFSAFDDAMRVTSACVQQMRSGGLLQISEDIRLSFICGLGARYPIGESGTKKTQHMF